MIPSTLKIYFQKNKIQKFRLKQIMRAYFVEGKKSWDEVSTLPQDLRHKLVEEFEWFDFKVAKLQEDLKDCSAKALLEFSDGKSVETVLIRHPKYYTVCVSSQVGCPMKCAFCATGSAGYTRNLTAGEIADQVIFWNNYLQDNDPQKIDRVGNLVFMGMGEPFLNWDNVKQALEIITNQKLINIGQRHISISTCGIVDKIKQFTKEGTQINLAISLHSANNQTRGKIMPVNKKYPLKQLLTACLNYVEQSKRKLFFEYTLLQGINDTDQEIETLAELIKSHYLYHLNLIPYNKTSGKFKPTSRTRQKQITDFLDQNRISYTMRKSFGPKIDAACGQLKS